MCSSCWSTKGEHSKTYPHNAVIPSSYCRPSFHWRSTWSRRCSGLKSYPPTRGGQRFSGRPHFRPSVSALLLLDRGDTVDAHDDGMRARQLRELDKPGVTVQPMPLSAHAYMGTTQPHTDECALRKSDFDAVH